MWVYMLVNVNELADFFGRDPRTVQLWAEKDGMPREARGEYDMMKCARWKIQKLEDENDILRNNMGDEKLYDLKREDQIIKNKEREVKVRKMIGELVSVEAVRLAWTNETKNFRKALKALKNKLNYSLSGVIDDIKRRELISRDIDEISEFLSELPIDAEDNESLFNEIQTEN